MPSWSELWSQGNCSSDYECRWSFHQRSIWVNWRDTTGGQSHLKDRECTQSWVYCKFVNLFVHPDGFVRLYSHQNRAPPTATTDCQLLCESSIGIIVGRTLKPVFSHPATVLFSRFCWFISSYSFISHHIPSYWWSHPSHLLNFSIKQRQGKRSDVDHPRNDRVAASELGQLLGPPGCQLGDSGENWEPLEFPWDCRIHVRTHELLVGALEHEFYDFPYIFHILGIVIPTDSTDSYFSEGLKPPTSLSLWCLVKSWSKHTHEGMTCQV